MPFLALSLVMWGIVFTAFMLITNNAAVSKNGFMLIVLLGFIPVASGAAFYVRYNRRRSFIRRMSESAMKHKGIVTLNQLIDDTKILPVDLEHILEIMQRKGKITVVESNSQKKYDFKQQLQSMELG